MYIFDQTTLSFVSATGGFLGAVGGLFAAIAAFRSAGLARDSAKRAEQVEHRELVRSLVATLQSIIAETMRVDDLANKLKTQYKGLSILHGKTGENRAKELTTSVEKKQSGVGVFQQDARKNLEDIKSIRMKPEEEINSFLLKFDGHLIQIRRVKEKLEEDLVTFIDMYQPGGSIGV